MADERTDRVSSSQATGQRERLRDNLDRTSPHTGAGRGPRSNEARMKERDEFGEAEEDTDVRRETETAYAMGETDEAGEGRKVTPEGDVFGREGAAPDEGERKKGERS